MLGLRHKALTKSRGELDLPGRRKMGMVLRACGWSAEKPQSTRARRRAFVACPKPLACPESLFSEVADS